MKHIEFRRAWIIPQSLTGEGLIEKGKKANGGKKSKQCMTVMFIVASNGSFVFGPTVI